MAILKVWAAAIAIIVLLIVLLRGASDSPMFRWMKPKDKNHINSKTTLEEIVNGDKTNKPDDGNGGSHVLFGIFILVFLFIEFGM